VGLTRTKEKEVNLCLSLLINYSILLTGKNKSISIYKISLHVYVQERIIESEFVLVTKDRYPSLTSEIPNKKKKDQKSSDNVFWREDKAA